MTREEAKIVFLNRGYVEVDGGTYYDPDKWRESCRVISEWLEQESLTDKEQRIFLAAMGREEKICREVDDRYPDREAYEDSLVSVCRSIKRKVKKALWE